MLTNTERETKVIFTFTEAGLKDLTLQSVQRRDTCHSKFKAHFQFPLL